jgi:uncharacterized glyoxalase superfamily protein PhnB
MSLSGSQRVGIEVTLDCNNIEGLARFWQEALGCEAHALVPGSYVSLTTAEGFTLTLQAVPEPKVGKNRMHLDLLVNEVEDAAVRLQSLGATKLSPRQELYGTHWYVMADPEGNEFCLGSSPASSGEGVTDAAP